MEKSSPWYVSHITRCHSVNLAGLCVQFLMFIENVKDVKNDYEKIQVRSIRLHGLNENIKAFDYKRCFRDSGHLCSVVADPVHMLT